MGEMKCGCFAYMESLPPTYKNSGPAIEDKECIVAELVQALDVITKRLEPFNRWDGTEFRKQMDHAKALLAKAKGLHQ